MSLTYTSWVDAITTMCTLAGAVELTTVLPLAIDNAEARCYRDLDVINLDVIDASASTTALVREFTLPTAVGTFQIVEKINIITPAQVAPASGTRNQLIPVSQAVLDAMHPSTTGAGIPNKFAYISQSAIAGQKNIIFGPWPDAAYRVEVVGKIQWTALSAVNTTTFLTLYYPELFLAASMVFMNGYLKNFGAQADDPRSALSWEQHYKDLLGGASVWEARKRMASSGWTAEQPEPLAKAAQAR